MLPEFDYPAALTEDQLKKLQNKIPSLKKSVAFFKAHGPTMLAEDKTLVLNSLLQLNPDLAVSSFDYAVRINPVDQDAVLASVGLVRGTQDRTVLNVFDYSLAEEFILCQLALLLVKRRETRMTPADVDLMATLAREVPTTNGIKFTIPLPYFDRDDEVGTDSAVGPFSLHNSAWSVMSPFLGVPTDRYLQLTYWPQVYQIALFLTLCRVALPSNKIATSNKLSPDDDVDYRRVKPMSAIFPFSFVGQPIYYRRDKPATLSSRVINGKSLDYVWRRYDDYVKAVFDVDMPLSKLIFLGFSSTKRDNWRKLNDAEKAQLSSNRFAQDVISRDAVKPLSQEMDEVVSLTAPSIRNTSRTVAGFFDIVF